MVDSKENEISEKSSNYGWGSLNSFWKRHEFSVGQF